jgi:hypothetical protein
VIGLIQDDGLMQGAGRLTRAEQRRMTTIVNKMSLGGGVSASGVVNKRLDPPMQFCASYEADRAQWWRNHRTSPQDPRWPGGVTRWRDSVQARAIPETARAIVEAYLMNNPGSAAAFHELVGYFDVSHYNIAPRPAHPQLRHAYVLPVYHLRVNTLELATGFYYVLGDTNQGFVAYTEPGVGTAVGFTVIDELPANATGA